MPKRTTTPPVRGPRSPFVAQRGRKAARPNLIRELANAGDTVRRLRTRTRPDARPARRLNIPGKGRGR